MRGTGLVPAPLCWISNRAKKLVGRRRPTAAAILVLAVVVWASVSLGLIDVQWL